MRLPLGLYRTVAEFGRTMIVFCVMCADVKELEEAKHQLSAEQNKVFKLEVELAEAQQRLQQVTDLEKELAHYRCLPLASKRITAPDRMD